MRGRVSYVTLMVLNPIIILFYQNCSVIPASASRAQASIDPPAVVMTDFAPHVGFACDQRLASCPENLE